MRFHYYYLFIFIFLFSNIAAFGKSLEEVAQAYIDAPNNDNLYDIFMLATTEDKNGFSLRTEDEITEFLFLSLDKLAENPSPPSLQYIFRLNQVLQMIFKNVDISKFRKSEICNTNLDDKYVKILFKALRAKMFILQGADRQLAEFLEKVTEINLGYSEKTKAEFVSEQKRIGLLDTWENQYLKKEKSFPPIVALPKKIVAYEMFLDACKTYNIFYEEGTCLDGGSIWISFTNFVRRYDIFFNQSTMGKYKDNPVSIRIVSNSNNYYASTILEFPVNNEKHSFAEFNDERFFEAIKGKFCNPQIIVKLKSVADSCKDKNVKKQLDRFLRAIGANKNFIL